MAKEVVYKVKLEASQFKEGLKGVSDGIKQLQKLLEKPLAVKIDEGQVRKLEKFLAGRFDNMGQQLRATMNGAAKDTIKALGGIQTAIEKMAPKAQAASTQVGNALAAGVRAGTTKALQSLSRDLSQLENRALNSAENIVKRYKALGDQARQTFQKALPATRTFSSDPEALATELIGSFSGGKKGRTTAFDVKAQGDFDRALKAAEAFQSNLEARHKRFNDFERNQDKVRAEAERKESERQKKELAGRIQTHEEYADDLQKRAEGSARRQLAQRNREAKEREDAEKQGNAKAKARVAQADREFSGRQKEIGEQLRLAREMRKGATQEEAREIEQRIAGLKRAQEVERRLASDKVQAQREFERLQKKALAGGVSTADAGIELSNPRQLLSAGFLNTEKVARYTAALDLAIQRARELQRIQNTPQHDDSMRSQLAFGNLSFRARMAGINPADIGLHGPESLRSAAAHDPLKEQQITQQLALQKKHMQDQAAAAKNLNTAQRSTENSISRTVLFMARWLIFIRLVHEVVALIERGIGAIVQGGLEYLKTQELQKIALTATLNEHAKITDAQGNQLQGVVSLFALQGAVNQQWKDLQRMSLSVVGSTQDLMDIYVALIPAVGHLKGNLGDVQKLTRSTALAAGALDIPFQDARTAIVSLLRGNFLQRNRLVGALGITEAEVKRLKNTPELLDRVVKSLRSFDLLADTTQQSLGALTETFGELTQRLGGELMTPFANVFKDAVKFIQGTLFDKDFQPNPATALFLDKIKAAMGDIVDRFKQFGREIIGEGPDALMSFMLGVRNTVDGLASLATQGARAALEIGKFIAQNRVLIEWIAKLTLLKVGADLFANLNTKVIDNVSALRAWISAATAFGRTAPAIADGAVSVASAMGNVTGAASGLMRVAPTLGPVLMALSNAFASLLPALVVGGIVLGITRIIQKLAELKQAREDFAHGQDRINRGDVMGGLADLEPQRSSSNVDVAATATRGVGLASNKKVEGLFQLLGPGGDPFTRVVDEYKRTTEQINAKSQEFTAAMKINATERMAVIAAERLKLMEHRDELVNNLQDQVNLGAETVRVADVFQKLQKVSDENKEARAKVGVYDKGVKIGEKSASVDAATLQAYGLSQAEIDQLGNKRVETEAALENIIKTIGPRAAKAKAALAALRDIDASVQLKDDGKGATSGHKGQEPFFLNDIDQAMNAAMRLLDDKQRVYDAMHRNILLTEKDFIEKSRILEDQKYQTAIAFLDAEEKAYNKHEQDVINFHKQKGDYDDPNVKQNIEERGRQFRSTLFSQRQTVEGDRRTALAIRDIDDLGLARRLKREFDEAKPEVQGFIDGMFGKTEDKTVDAFDKKIEEIKQRFERAPEIAKPLIEQLLGTKSDAARFKQAQRDLANVESQLSKLQQRHQSLDAQLTSGAISQAQYAEGVKSLRGEEDQLLVKKIALIDVLRMLGEQYGADADQLNQLAGSQDAAAASLSTLRSEAMRAHQAFQDLQNVMGAFQEVGQIFKGFGSSFNNVMQGIEGVSRFGQGIKDLTSSLSQLKTSSGQTSFGNFFSQFSAVGAFFKKKDFNNPFTGNGVDGQSVASTASSVIGGITFGVGAAISVAGALFERAVKHIKEKVTKNLEDVSKALSDGTINLAQADERLEQARKDAIAKYSGSKAGRAALKDLLPDIDKQLDDLKNRAKDIRKSFDEKLRDTKLGSGPFADFAKMLLDLEKTTKEYLDTFRKGTQQYADALRKVSELWDATLRQAKLNLQSQLFDFNSQAINDAMQVFDLMDQRAELFEQLADVEERFADLREQEKEDAIDKEKEWNQIQKTRTDNAKKMLDLQKQIADVIRKAAEDEAEIRRRGVLEAQETIAVTKAREISQVRNEAQDRIDDLRDQLKELQDAQSDTSAIDDFNKKWEKRAKQVEKETKELDKQRAKTREQIRLNEVRLRVAREIAQIEGAVFDLTGDRISLEERAGKIAIEQARIRVKQWEETKKLIESIIESGKGVLFTPPPGFPQINVKIGDINVNTTNNQNGTGTGQGDGGGGGGDGDHGGREGRDERRERRKPRAIVSDVERQLGERIGGIR